MVAAGKRVAAVGTSCRESGKATKRRVEHQQQVDKEDCENAAPVSAEEWLTVTPLDSVSKECLDILTILDRADGLSKVSREMIRSAAPHALRAPCPIGEDKPTRHEYQERFIGKLAEIFEQAEVREASAINAADEQSATIASERSAAEEAFSAAEAKAVECTSACERSDATVKCATSAVVSARADVSEETSRRNALEATRDAQSARKVNHEHLLAETWAPLKEGAFVGNQWRQRNKMIDSLQEFLEEVRVEESLREALVVALKGKFGDRGVFGAKAVEFCDGLLAEHLAAINQELDSHAAKVLERSEAAAALDTTLVNAEALQSDRMTELVAADTASCEAKEEMVEALRIVKELRPKEAQVAERLELAKADHANVTLLCKRFQALRDVGAAGA